MTDSTSLILSFDGSDLKQSRGPTDLIFTFGLAASICPQIRDTSNTTSVDFTCDCAETRSGYNNFLIDCSKTYSFFDSMRAYSGENALNAFSIEFIPKGYFGSEASCIFNTRPAYDIVASAYTGEQLSFNLSYNYQFVTSTNFDNRLQTNLTTVAPVNLTFNGYAGDEAVFNLSPTFLFVPTTNFDNRLQVNLTSVSPVTLDFTGYSGDESTLVYNNTFALSFAGYSGDDVNATLTAVAPVNFTPAGYSGDEGHFQIPDSSNMTSSGLYGESSTLVYNPTLALSFSGNNTGDSSIVILTTKGPPLVDGIGLFGFNNTFLLSTVLQINGSGYYGETGGMSLDVHAAAPIALSGYSGESGNLANILVQTSIPANNYFGDAAAFELDTRLPYYIKADAYSGENGNLSFVLNGIRNVNAISGETFRIPSISTLPNWIAAYGENATFAIITDATFGNNSYSGENGAFNLTVPPPVTLSFNARFGLDNSLILGTQISHKFLMYTTMELYYHDNTLSQFQIDLNTTACCPTCNPYDLQRIEMSRAETYDVSYAPGSMDLNAQMTFRTQPRFTFKAYAGENVAIIDHSVYLSFAAYSGESSKTKDLTTLPNIELGLGNFLPVGDNIDVELTKLPDPTVYGQAAYLGEWVGMELSVAQNIGPIQMEYEQYVMNAIVTFDPAPRHTAYYGEQGRFNLSITVALRASISSGDYGFNNIYVEPPEKFIIECGDVASITELKMAEYEVMFTESGVMQNNFIESNENGDPVITPTSGQTMEGEDYTHFITGICF